MKPKNMTKAKREGTPETVIQRKNKRARIRTDGMRILRKPYLSARREGRSYVFLLESKGSATRCNLLVLELRRR
jgi:hypothetical protein